MVKIEKNSWQVKMPFVILNEQLAKYVKKNKKNYWHKMPSFVILMGQFAKRAVKKCPNKNVKKNLKKLLTLWILFGILVMRRGKNDKWSLKTKQNVNFE